MTDKHSIRTPPLSEQVAVVTGGGRGIGRAIAAAFARAGASVAIAARTSTELEETVAAIGAPPGRVIAVPTDVRNEHSVDRLIKRVTQKLGRVDVLVNDAATYGAVGPLWESDPQIWWNDIETNLRGTYLCCRAVLPHMVERRWGKIINISGGGSGGFPYGTAYASSKVAITRLTECLAAEVDEFGVQVFALSPGLVRTSMTEHQITSPDGRRWLPKVGEMIANGRDVPAERAAELALALALSDGRLSGRSIGVGDDLDQLLRCVDEIKAEHLYQLRLQKLRP